MSAGGGPDVAQGARPEPTGRGRVVVLSGPSAVGKSTVVRCLRERIPNLQFSVSATTRAPRPGEVDGVDYHFVTPARFQQLIDDGALLEALPKVGKVKAQEIMTELEIAPTRRLRGLGDRQRKALLEKFGS